MLLLASGVLMVLRLAPTPHASLRMGLVLAHFLLSLLMVEWAILLAFCCGHCSFLAEPRGGTQLRFRGYSLALLGGGGYFTVGREMSDFVFFAFLRISVYLVVLLWWSVCLWLPEPG